MFSGVDENSTYGCNSFCEFLFGGRSTSAFPKSLNVRVTQFNLCIFVLICNVSKCILYNTLRSV